ncbi:MAG: hypothetical protein SFV51_03630, partial [Bryobacteraceae bacterium]|nr:hypothetical protein [Bryobacteraceae bacterium]
MSSLAVAVPPPLHEGDSLDAAEFLRRWDAMPELRQAELINGIVFMASPVALPHSTFHNSLSGWVAVYQSQTPGCEAGNDGTWKMGPRDIPQPDIFLRILP